MSTPPLVFLLVKLSGSFAQWKKIIMKHYPTSIKASELSVVVRVSNPNTSMRQRRAYAVNFEASLVYIVRSIDRGVLISHK